MVNRLTPAAARLIGALARRAAGLLAVRPLARAPIRLFRARLGFLFGSRLLLLEHVGRRSGVRRRVVLEVVARPRPGSYVVASGFGARAQWFRNVRSHPAVRVQVGGHRPVPATARPLTGPDAAAALGAYRRAHPRAWALLRPVFEATLDARIDDTGSDLPLVALDLDAPRS